MGPGTSTLSEIPLQPPCPNVGVLPTAREGTIMYSEKYSASKGASGRGSLFTY
jgi:hypothetical protein